MPASNVESRFKATVSGVVDESSGEAVIGRLSDGFRSLTTDEQMQAILSKKRKQAMLDETETANTEAHAESENPTDSTERMEVEA